MNINIGKILAGLLSATAFGATTYALANESGSYVGVQAGYGAQRIESVATITSPIIQANRKNGIAGRIYGGYKFNENLAVELGGSKYSNATWKALNNTTITLKTYAVDLLAKGIVPISDKVSVFGQAGAAYVKANISAPNNTTLQSANFVRPKVALGAEYAINENLSANVTASRIFKKGSVTDNKYLPNLDMATIGLQYQIS